jgi:hypothetical protein
VSDEVETLTGRLTGKTKCCKARGHSSRELAKPTDLNLWFLQIFAGVN